MSLFLEASWEITALFPILLWCVWWLVSTTVLPGSLTLIHRYSFIHEVSIEYPLYARHWTISPGDSDGKHLSAMQKTWVQSLGQEDSPGEWNCSPLQNSCLENSMNRGAWWATVYGTTKIQTWLSTPQHHLQQWNILSASPLSLEIKGATWPCSVCWFSKCLHPYPGGSPCSL